MYLEALVSNIRLGVVAPLGTLLPMVESGVMLGDDGVVSLLELGNHAHLIGILVVEVTVEHLVDLPGTEILEGRLDSVGDHLIGGLEVALAVISGLDARVCEVLDSATASGSAA